MSTWLDIKSEFLREAVSHAWTEPGQESPKFRANVPERILKRWYAQIGTPISTQPGRPRRLVNHFKLGADPECAFIADSGERVPANDLDFKAALAWGADNNGRLIEIRPWPCRYALAVGASIWSTLHWMAVLQPETLSLTWRSGAWFSGDGMGGHIHLGRKRPTIERETQALDHLAFLLYHSNVYNQAEGRERIRRTRGHGNYGSLGDRRQQPYGYEYRTFPSWLDSPWLAYLSLVLAKCVVFDPELIPIMTEQDGVQTAGQAKAKLRAILAYFKGRDDDAALAHQVMLRHGFPRFDTTDFKPRWGIFSKPSGNRPSYTSPSMIQPSPASTQEFGQALLENRPPDWQDTEPTWKPHTLPTGFEQCITYSPTYHAPGLGELVHDLVFHSSIRVRITRGDSGTIDIPREIFESQGVDRYRANTLLAASGLPIKLYATERGVKDWQDIYIGRDYLEEPEARKQVFALLTSGWLPIWRASEANAESLAEWLKRVTPPKIEVPSHVAQPGSRQLWPRTKVKVPEPQRTVGPSIQVDWATITARDSEAFPVLPISPGTVDTARNFLNEATRFYDFEGMELPQPSPAATQSTRRPRPWNPEPNLQEE